MECFEWAVTCRIREFDRVEDTQPGWEQLLGAHPRGMVNLNGSGDFIVAE
jgi:hypothetical protein